MGRHQGPPDFKRVRATPEEVEAYRAKARKLHYQVTSPSVYRVECRRCGKRIWGSGMGIGSHRRACRGVQA